MVKIMKYIRLLLTLSCLLFAKIVFALPPGSYLQSCNSCSETFNTLTCRCSDYQGYSVISSLWNANSCFYVTSDSLGHLECHHRGNPLPPGSYQNTCQACHMDPWGNLHCLCHTRDHRLVPSVYPNARNCGLSLGITNQNGQLTCGQPYVPPYPPVFAMPNGNYQSTCHNCYMNGPDLSCTCQRRQWGLFERSYLPQAASCNFVENIDGQLRCTMQPGPFMGNPHR